MAHVWIWDEHDGAGEWAIAPLSGDRVALGGGGSVLYRIDRARVAPDGIVLLRAAAAVGDTWVVLAGRARLSVNGQPVTSGIRALADRDELVAPTIGRCFFSIEQLAAVVPFPPGAPANCRRCTEPIAPGAPAVACPGCGVWYHAGDASRTESCWKYCDRCADCLNPTTDSDRYRWIPEAPAGRGRRLPLDGTEP